MVGNMNINVKLDYCNIQLTWFVVFQGLCDFTAPSPSFTTLLPL